LLLFEEARLRETLHGDGRTIEDVLRGRAGVIPIRGRERVSRWVGLKSLRASCGKRAWVESV
jgi:hypothetical protein